VLQCFDSPVRDVTVGFKPIPSEKGGMGNASIVSGQIYFVGKVCLTPDIRVKAQPQFSSYMSKIILYIHNNF